MKIYLSSDDATTTTCNYLSRLTLFFTTTIIVTLELFPRAQKICCTGKTQTFQLIPTKSKLNIRAVFDRKNEQEVKPKMGGI